MGTREETPRAQEQANDQPFPPPALGTRERRNREKRRMATTTTICLLAAAMLLVSGASAQRKPCPRKVLVAQAEGLYVFPATAQQNATVRATNATATNATDVAEVANDTIALRSEGCYDITVHKCDCDADLTEESCTDMGRIWTVHCECHLEELAGTQSRRVLLQFEDAPMMNDTMMNMTMDANATEPAGDEVLVVEEPVEEEEPAEEEAPEKEEEAPEPEPEPVSVDIAFPDAPEGAPDVANTLG